MLIYGYHCKGLSTLATKVAENGDKKYPKLVAENGNIRHRKRILFVSVFSDFCRQCGQAFRTNQRNATSGCSRSSNGDITPRGRVSGKRIAGREGVVNKNLTS